MATHYDVLGVPATATPEEVRSAYRSRARELHPDRTGHPRAMQDLNEAWRVLRDPARRAAYDQSLRAAPVRVHDADDPADWRYNRPAAPSGDLGVSLVRALPWLVVLFVLGVIFVFTAFARTDRSSSGDLVDECVRLEAGRPVAVSCAEENLGRVSLVVERQSLCPSETDAVGIPGNRWLCVRPAGSP